MAKKGSQRGKKKSLSGIQKLGLGIARAVSYHLRPKKAKGHRVVWIRTGRSFGKYFYTVESPIEPVTFTKKKDADAFKRLLKNSTAEYRSDIVKREITEEGYHVQT